jgi:transcription-repair coupling factor (superfamily II helicase)
MNHKAIWKIIEANATRVAREHELVGPKEKFTLTDDQKKSVETINRMLDEGVFEFLLKAPTGSGKTEVMMRVAIDTVLNEETYVCVIAPTRDLVRQHVQYFTERLEGTPMGVAQVHGGMSPGERKAAVAGIADGSIRVVVGSAMMLSSDHWWHVIDNSGLLVIDDVNAFDEREHLRLLEDLDCPMLFATATRIGAMNNVVQMKGMPFDVLPTKIHKPEGVWGEPPAEQLAHADALIRDHLERKSRIFVISRTRGDVPKLAERLEALYGIPVQQLRGDMADTAEHGNRHRRAGVKVSNIGTRVEMMNAFRNGAPAILAATNLVGSGLDVPAADLIVVTDADAFGEAEIEQLIGRVGRRERPSDAVLVSHTTFEKNPSRGMGAGGPRRTFMPRGMRANQLRFTRRR